MVLDISVYRTSCILLVYCNALGDNGSQAAGSTLYYRHKMRKQP